MLWNTALIFILFAAVPTAVWGQANSSATSNAMFQRQPVQKLHGDESFAVLVVNFVDGANVGVIQCRGSLRLALEAG